MPRPRKTPLKAPADPAHISEVRRAAAAKSVAARRERSANQGRRPKVVNIRAATYDKMAAYAKASKKTMIDAATEVVEHGIAHLLRS